MSYCRVPWYIWRGGGLGPENEDFIAFASRDIDGIAQTADESTLVPLSAIRCFLLAWLRQWPDHMTVEGMVKRIEAGDIDPEITMQRHGPR